MDEYLNDDWIKEFETTDKLYSDFYKDDLYYTNLYFVYINKNNEIEKIKCESFIMSEKNCITREEIIQILNNNSVLEKTKYSILSILRYNITLDEYDVKNFLSSNENEIIGYNEKFLNPIKNIDAIYFGKTINMFQDLNDVMFIFKEKTNENKKLNTNNITKRHLLSRLKNNKKTIRKQYK